MKNLENLPEEIFDLLSSKPYAELTGKEQKQLEGFISESEYGQYHEMLVNFVEIDESIQLNYSEVDLPNAPQAKTKVRDLLTRQIPLYQAAAAVLIFMFSSAFLTYVMSGKSLPNEDAVVAPNNQEIQLVVDTVVAPIQGKSGQSLADDDYPKGLIFSL